MKGIPLPEARLLLATGEIAYEVGVLVNQVLAQDSALKISRIGSSIQLIESRIENLRKALAEISTRVDGKIGTATSPTKEQSNV